MGTGLEGIVDEYARRTVPGGFHLDSGYYAGRPPSSSDIDTKTLEGIYKGLKAKVGQKAATNFVRFVNKLEDMSASSFIVALQRFWHSDCDKVYIAQPKEDHVANEAGAFATLALGLTGRRASQDEVIRLSEKLKAQFIAAHSREIPAAERKAF